MARVASLHKKIVVLAALKEELRPLRQALDRPDVELVLTGVGPERAAAAARKALGGARLALTTGCCGGMVPGAAAGLVLVPERLMLRVGDQMRPAPAPDPHWAREAQLLAEQMGLHCSARPLLTVPAALTSPTQKRRWHQLTGAVGVDMETAAIATVAGDLGVPHLCIRTVLDSVEDSLPEQPLTGPDGRLRKRRLARAILKPRKLLERAGLQVKLRGISRTAARLIALLLSDQMT